MNPKEKKIIFVESRKARSYSLATPPKIRIFGSNNFTFIVICAGPWARSQTILLEGKTLNFEEAFRGGIVFHNPLNKVPSGATKWFRGAMPSFTLPLLRPQICVHS